MRNRQNKSHHCHQHNTDKIHQTSKAAKSSVMFSGSFTEGPVTVRICHFSFLQQSNEEVAFSRYKGRENERLHSPYSDNSPRRWNVHLQSPSAPMGSTLHSLHSAAGIRRYPGKSVLASPLAEGGEPANTSKTGVQIGYGWVELLGVLNLDLI